MQLPDNTIHMDEVKRLAEEARQPKAGADAPTPVDLGKPSANPGVVAPIYMGRDTDLIPERYVIHYSFVQCRNCGEATRESEFYALSYIRSRINGTRVRQLTKVSRAMYNLPVDKILTGCHHVPYCQACDKIDLSHLPPVPQDAHVTVRTLAEPTLKGQKPKQAAPAKPTAPKKAATLDDLI